METGLGRKYGAYVVLVAGIIMCLTGAYLMITEEGLTPVSLASLA